MQIQLNAERVTVDTIKELKSILVRSDQGLCGVGFEYQTHTGVCQLAVDNGWKIVPNKVMLDQLDSLVGQKSIRLIY